MSDEDSDFDDELEELLEEIECPLASTPPNDDVASAVEDEIVKYQKSMWQLEYLPYYKELDLEADEQLCIIKNGLGKAILSRDIRPGALHWICELDKYMNLYNRRFTKADQICLVNLVYSLVFIPDLDLRMVKVFAQVLSNLLIKRDLLSRNDIILDWRPLYEKYCFVSYKNLEQDGTFLLTEHIQTGLETLIVRCRAYFSLDSTQEILDELRPFMCPWDTSMHRAITCMSLFLPTVLTPEEHLTHGYILWFDEIMQWYTLVQNCAPWETRMCQLLARLSRDQIGRIAWEKYYDLLFTRLHRSLGLAIGKGDSMVLVGPGARGFNIESACVFIASCLGGKENRCQKYLGTLLQSVENYLHPSNYAYKYVDKLLSFMSRLTLAVCQRLNKERHKKADWHIRPEEDWLLKDKQVADFAESLMPCALLAMFSKHPKQELIGQTMRHLGQLAPAMILPALLQKLYPALESLTEPHRLFSSLTCLIAVIVPLIRDEHNGNKIKLEIAEDEEGFSSLRLHVIPLMNAILPGLDPNDFRKSAVTFQLLSLFCALVPIVDCSESPHLRNDLNQEEREICSQTATFEEFVSNMLDRMFNLIAMTAQGCASGHHSASAKGTIAGYEESFLKGGINSLFKSLLGNCSSDIYDMIVDKHMHFMKENVFEHRISSEIMGEMAHATIRSKPSHLLPKFLKYLHEELVAHITPETAKEEQISESTIYYLVVTSHVLKTYGVSLQENQNMVIDILSLVYTIESRNSIDLVAQIFEHILSSLSAIYSFTNVDKLIRLDIPLEKRLHIRHWAEPWKKEQLSIKWHVPNKEEINMVKCIVEKFMQPIVKIVTKLPENMKGEELLRQLTILKGIFVGIAALVPLFDGKTLKLVDTFFPVNPFKYVNSPKSAPKLDVGENVRNSVMSALNSLISHLLLNNEDDTKSLLACCKIMFNLLFYKGVYRSKVDQHVRGFEITKGMVGNVIVGKKAFIEPLQIEFINIQHYKRVNERSGYAFTEMHVLCMKNLVKLSTSHYSAVRRESQAILEACFNSFPYSYKYVLDDVLPLLDNNKHVSHEQFKGALYILSMGGKKSISLRQSWATLLKVWPAIIKAQHSEKPSVIQLLEKIQNSIVDNIESFQITLQVPDICVNAAKKLLELSEENISLSEEQIKDYHRKLDDRNKENEKLYYDLVAEMVKLSNDSNLHWRHTDMAQSLLTLLVRIDTHLPQEAISTLVRLLTHDTVKSRRMSVAFMAAWLKVEKKKSVKVEMKLEGEQPKFPTKYPIKWGFRKNNKQIFYNDKEVPKTKEEYDKVQFVEKQHCGFYCWEKKPLTYAPPDKQPKWNRSREELAPAELPLFDAFTNPEFVRKFCDLLSLEDKKGADQFLPQNYQLFKGLLRAFGDAPLKTLSPIILEYVSGNKEGQQRMCAEFTAGALQGAKTWPFEKVCELQDFLTKIVTKAIEKLSSESFKNWGSAIATISDSRDPRRLKFLVELLFNFVPESADGISSFHMSNRLYLLQGLLNQMEWKALPLWQRLFTVIKPHIIQPYQNLRDRLGSCISTMVWFDLPGLTFDIDDEDYRPVSHEKLLSMFKPHLAPLWKELENASPGDENSANDDKKKLDVDRSGSILSLKTLLCYLNSHWSHCLNSMPTSIMQLLPLLLYFENETTDDELKKDAKFQVLHGFSRAHLCVETVDLMLSTLEFTMNNCKWWKTRTSVLKVLQTSVYCNLFLYSQPIFKQKVASIVERLVKDSRLEVRESAGETLSGLMNCSYFQVTNKTVAHYSLWTRNTSDILVRHAGIIALSSVVKAFPYSVPKIMPNILMIICKHASAPAPINTTVKKTLSEFKRTHQDSWNAEHKHNFTENQLDVLNDLLISHNYYV